MPATAKPGQALCDDLSSMSIIDAIEMAPTGRELITEMLYL